MTRSLRLSLSLLSMHNAQVSRIKIWDNPVTNAVEYYKLLPCLRDPGGVISRCGFKCLRGVFARECSYDESNWAGVNTSTLNAPDVALRFESEHVNHRRERANGCKRIQNHLTPECRLYTGFYFCILLLLLAGMLLLATVMLCVFLLR